MATRDCHAFDSLASQIDRQRKYAWDLETDIPWTNGIDTSRSFLPLDKNAIAFPELDTEQRIALSQLSGLIVNATIAELESVIDRFRERAWRRFLKEYPVNPEMERLGELFFEEELKHSRLFRRFNDQFCQSIGIEPAAMGRLLPQLYGSRSLDRISANAASGGCAFWWVVASVEEVSILIFREMAPHKKGIDPLFFEIHKKHMEEETRHCNFAFLVLDMVRSVQNRKRSLKMLLHEKTDLVFAQALTASWLLGELQKLWRVQKMKTDHPFFACLATVMPHFQKNHWLRLPQLIFANSPYLSLFLNLRHHRETLQKAREFGTPRIPMPRPSCPPTFAEARSS